MDAKDDGKIRCLNLDGVTAETHGVIAMKTSPWTHCHGDITMKTAKLLSDTDKRDPFRSVGEG